MGSFDTANILGSLADEASGGPAQNRPPAWLDDFAKSPRSGYSDAILGIEPGVAGSFAAPQPESISPVARPPQVTGSNLLRDISDYLGNSAEALSRMPRGIAGMGREF